MNRFFKKLSMVAFTGTLAIPITLSAHSTALQNEKQDHEEKERAEKAEKADKAEKKLRVYDAKHSDYHDWNANEDRAYRRYLSERHEEYREYGKLPRDRQADYWEWRHNNPDRDDVDRDRDAR